MKIIENVMAVLSLVVVSVGIARAQEFPKPGPEQELLKQMVGDWDAQVKSTCPMTADKGPQESRGEYTAKMDLGGFFLATEFKGDMGGKPFQGRGIGGYDPVKKKYVGVWVDSMVPFMHHTEGEFDASGKVYTETLDGRTPDGQPMKMRITTEIKDKDHMLFQLFAPGKDGKEARMMEINYTRKK